MGESENVLRKISRKWNAKVKLERARVGQVGGWSPMFPERGTVVLLILSLLPLGPNS